MRAPDRTSTYAAGAPFAQYSFDVTAAANGEYQADGVLSLVFKEIDESTIQTWEYWHSQEALPDPLNPAQQPFTLDVTIAAVSEPASGALLALGLAALASARQWGFTPGSRASALRGRRAAGNGCSAR